MAAAARKTHTRLTDGDTRATCKYFIYGGYIDISEIASRAKFALPCLWTCALLCFYSDRNFSFSLSLYLFFLRGLFGKMGSTIRAYIVSNSFEGELQIECYIPSNWQRSQ